MNNNVVQQSLTGMITLMLAKFMLNDVPHAAGMLPSTPTGLCYPDTWSYVMHHPSAMLVHGTAFSSMLGKRVGHAWVELPNGSVWEPSSQAVLPAERFHSLVEPVVESRYTSDEAAVMLARVGKHGSWTAEQRKEYLGG